MLTHLAGGASADPARVDPGRDTVQSPELWLAVNPHYSHQGAKVAPVPASRRRHWGGPAAISEPDLAGGPRTGLEVLQVEYTFEQTGLGEQRPVLEPR